VGLVQLDQHAGRDVGVLALGRAAVSAKAVEDVAGPVPRRAAAAQALQARLDGGEVVLAQPGQRVVGGLARFGVVTNELGAEGLEASDVLFVGLGHRDAGEGSASQHAEREDQRAQPGSRAGAGA